MLRLSIGVLLDKMCLLGVYSPLIFAVDFFAIILFFG